MKKAATILLIFALIFTLSTAAFAAHGAAMPGSSPPVGGHRPPMDQLQEKFDALTDQQREEVYKITDTLTAQLITLSEKYRELGVITEAEAKQIIAVLQDGYDMAKLSGRVIFALPPIR